MNSKIEKLLDEAKQRLDERFNPKKPSDEEILPRAKEILESSGLRYDIDDYRSFIRELMLNLNIDRFQALSLIRKIYEKQEQQQQPNFDNLYDKALYHVKEAFGEIVNKMPTTVLQRRLKIGYSRALILTEEMIEKGDIKLDRKPQGYV